MNGIRRLEDMADQMQPDARQHAEQFCDDAKRLIATIRSAHSGQPQSDRSFQMAEHACSYIAKAVHMEFVNLSGGAL